MGWEFRASIPPWLSNGSPDPSTLWFVFTPTPTEFLLLIRNGLGGVFSLIFITRFTMQNVNTLPKARMLIAYGNSNSEFSKTLGDNYSAALLRWLLTVRKAVINLLVKHTRAEVSAKLAQTAEGTAIVAAIYSLGNTPILKRRYDMVATPLTLITYSKYNSDGKIWLSNSVDSPLKETDILTLLGL